MENNGFVKMHLDWIVIFDNLVTEDLFTKRFHNMTFDEVCEAADRISYKTPELSSGNYEICLTDYGMYKAGLLK